MSQENGTSPGAPQDVEPEAEWAKRIGDCWRKSAGAFIQTGNLLIAAKRDLYTPKQWGYMFRVKGQPDRVPEPIPFSQSMADKLMRIARRFTNSELIPNLPAEWSVLDQLVGVDDDRLRAAGDLTGMTVAQAKRLLAGKPPLAKPEWTEADVIQAARAFAAKQLKRCPEGRERVVGHALNAAAHEILTPLPAFARDRLRSDLDTAQWWAERDSEDAINILTDRRALMGWIVSNGGLRLWEMWPNGEKVYRDYRPKDFPDDVKLRILRDDGRGLDVLAAVYAEQNGGKGKEKAIEDQMFYTLTTPNPRPTRTTTRAEIKKNDAKVRKIQALLNGRVLKTGWVTPIYRVLTTGWIEVRYAYGQVLEQMGRDARRVREQMDEQDRNILDEWQTEREEADKQRIMADGILRLYGPTKYDKAVARKKTM